MSRRINLIVVEGALEIPIASKLLDAIGVLTDDLITINKGGRIAFWKDAHRYNKAAAHLGPVLGLADLESAPCAHALFQKHLRQGKHRNFILRLTRPMSESWLLADAASLASFLSVPEHLFPIDPDNVPHPKKLLVQIASQSRSRAIRQISSQEPVAWE